MHYIIFFFLRLHLWDSRTDQHQPHRLHFIQMSRFPMTLMDAAGATLPKAPLPNWSNSSPIVAGGRVYCTAEPWEMNAYSPWLLCFDAVR